jgi:hypothetical protein
MSAAFSGLYGNICVDCVKRIHPGRVKIRASLTAITITAEADIGVVSYNIQMSVDKLKIGSLPNNTTRPKDLGTNQRQEGLMCQVAEHLREDQCSSEQVVYTKLGRYGELEAGRSTKRQQA